MEKLSTKTEKEFADMGLKNTKTEENLRKALAGEYTSTITFTAEVVVEG